MSVGDYVMIAAIIALTATLVFNLFQAFRSREMTKHNWSDTYYMGIVPHRECFLCGKRQHVHAAHGTWVDNGSDFGTSEYCD